MDPAKEPSLAILSAEDFVPEKYVRELLLSQNCVGADELKKLRNKINTLSEETSGNLKKNVYQNYMQFIETAKEISHLESEMYQLSHLLSEQKSLLSSMSNTTILGDENLSKSLLQNKENGVNPEEENREKISSVLEKVEGCKDLLVEGRTFLHEGMLNELDPLENNVIKTVYACLFNDGLMIATKNADSRGLMKYVYEVMYEFGSLAVVNVRDLGNIKHAFKLLIFPDTRVFKCNSMNVKKDWLEKFDHAKKSRLIQEQKKRESISDKSPSRAASIDLPSLNPFEEPEEQIGTIHPEWFLEIPDELDVCVAQRHFEEALTFLQKAKDYIKNQTSRNQKADHVLIDIQRKVDQRQQHLTEVLMKELEVNPDKSLQGGLRAARRAVRLLNQLGRPTQSCDLFLKLCSSMLKTQFKRVKKEGSTTMYVRHLSSVVFTNMCHMTEEFLRAFPNSPSCSSAYVVWACAELSVFTTHFIKQVFVPQTSLTTLTECVVFVRSQCERLCTYGIDLCYQLDGALRSHVTKALREAHVKLADSIKLRALEDKWIPSNLRTKTSLARCIQEYAEVGIKLDNFVTGEVWLQLTQNTLSFAKLFLNLLNDCLKIKTTELLHAIDETLYDVFDTQIRHYEHSLRSERQNEQRQFITKNAEFLVLTLINLAQEIYTENVGFESVMLKKIQKDNSALISGVSPTSRNTKVKTYSSDFL